MFAFSSRSLPVLKYLPGFKIASVGQQYRSVDARSQGVCTIPWMIPRGPLPKFELAFRSPLVVGTEIMGNSCTSARSAKAPQDTMETPPSRCETKEEQPIAWCHSSNRLNKEGIYAVPQLDAEFCSYALSTTTITLMDGWTTAHTEKLRAAVRDVVEPGP